MPAGVRRVLARLAVVVAILVLASLPFDRGLWSGIVVGGALIGGSTAVYAIGLLPLVKRGSTTLAIGVLFVKLAALLAVGWAVISRDSYGIDPIGFAVGVTCMPIASVWEAMAKRAP